MSWVLAELKLERNPTTERVSGITPSHSMAEMAHYLAAADGVCALTPTPTLTLTLTQP